MSVCVKVRARGDVLGPRTCVVGTMPVIVAVAWC